MLSLRKWFRLPIVWVIVLAAVMTALHGLALGWRFVFPFQSWIAASLVVFGLGIVGTSGWAFKQAGTTLNPVTPEQTSTLVTTGWYRYSRNPMYFGFLMALLGWAVGLGDIENTVVLAAFVVLANRRFIQPEEQVLARRFGSDFQQYQQEVRRWL